MRQVQPRDALELGDKELLGDLLQVLIGVIYHPLGLEHFQQMRLLNVDGPFLRGSTDGPSFAVLASLLE